MTTQHTPGPWTAYNSDHGRIFKNWRINAGTFHQIATVAERESSSEEMANARLIAAAPELLAACEAAAKLIETARQYFPKSIHKSEKFNLELVCAEIGKALDRAKN